MTAADKLRELLASRPALPNTEELVRWWRTSGELVEAFLRERAELVSDLVVADKREAQLRAEIDVLKQEVRELEQQRDAARAEARTYTKPCPRGFFCVHDVKCPGAA